MLIGTSFIPLAINVLCRNVVMMSIDYVVDYLLMTTVSRINQSSDHRTKRSQDEKITGRKDHSTKDHRTKRSQDEKITGRKDHRTKRSQDEKITGQKDHRTKLDHGGFEKLHLTPLRNHSRDSFHLLYKVIQWTFYISSTKSLKGFFLSSPQSQSKILRRKL